MFAIKLDQTNADFLTKPLFNITWDRREYTTEANGTKIKTAVKKKKICFVCLLFHQIYSFFFGIKILKYPMEFEPCTASHWEGLPAYGGVNWTALYTDGWLSSFLCPR